MRKIYLVVILFLSGNIVFSQCNGRYEAEIFNSVTVTEVNYSDVFSDNAHKMDVYTPDGDTETNRPLILFLHGGSFYGGDKIEPDCIDFCESFAKRGYVTASVNYRLVGILDVVNFLYYNSEQYEEVLKATSDIKSAIRYFRKDFSNGNTYGIDTSTIFVGGSSAGAIIAVHLAYIDDVSDLPTNAVDNDGSLINVQSIVNSLGGLEGDAGNNGFNSKVSGVISFAGGINDVSWIDSGDEPLVSIQGDQDLTVNYNCGPGLDNPTVLTLCGSGQMHPQANAVGIINDFLLYQGEGHSWFVSGNMNPKFTQALEFTQDFLYPLLPCNNTTDINEVYSQKKLIKVIDVLGREISEKTNMSLFYLYDDGSVEKRIIIQ